MVASEYRSVHDGDVDALATELLYRYEEITLLHGLSKSLSGLQDEESLCTTALNLASDAIGCERAWIALQDREGEALRFTVTRHAEALQGLELDPQVGITSYVAREGQRVLLHLDEGWPEGVPQAGAPVDALLSVPLIAPAMEGRHPALLGAMTLMGRPEGDRFTAGHSMLAATVSSLLAAAIHNARLVSSMRAADSARRAMEVAADVQKSLLPSRPPAVEGARAAGVCIAAENVGGDYYDLIVDTAGRLTLIIADVAGHSVGSALMMAAARGIMRQAVAAGASPGLVLRSTNDATIDDLTNAGLFITMFCARWDPDDRTLTYASGGHNPPLLRTRGVLLELDAEGMPAGLLPDVEYIEEVVQLDPGDLLLMYTDGVTEARNIEGEQFGMIRLAAVVDGAVGEVELAIASLHDAVEDFTGGNSGQDDLTIVALRVTQPAGA
jgi:serine phosphatase RsbU (regulator of sigma subunit)